MIPRTRCRSLPACSNILRTAQAISSGPRLDLRLAEQRPDRGSSRLVGRDDAKLLQHLDDRPIGDPLAVRKAAAADDLRVDRRQSLGDETRLADAGVGDDRHQLAAALPLRSLAPRPPGARTEDHWL